MKNDTKFILIILGLTATILIAILLISGKATRADSTAISRGKNVKGSEQAPNTLVEFSDFSCPACKSAEPFVESLIKKYPQELKFVYRHFPLPQHKLAVEAALAAEAAGMQGKFWEYKEKLFANQESLKENSFVEIAQSLNLDMEKFSRDLESAEISEVVRQDTQDARILNLDSTPTFFFNGEKIIFNSFGDLEKKIGSLLQNP